MRITRQPAYVLHTRPYRETSLLVDIFSRDHGRCRLLAKGARSLKNRRRGILMPFKPLFVGWSGKGTLQILTAAESTMHLADLMGIGLYAGLYANELLLKMLHRFDPHTKLYLAYDDAIHCLCSGKEPAQTLRIFEKHLLHEVGFGLILDHDVDSGQDIDPEGQYVYAPEFGPTAMQSAMRSGFDIQGATLKELDDGKFQSSRSRSEAKRLTRGLIDHQIDSRELRSRRVCHQILRYQQR